VILGFIADSLRHNYNSSKELLTISAMSTAVPGSLGAFLVHVKARMAVTGVLSEEESSRVGLRIGTDQNLPSDHDRLPVQKNAGVIKQADASFVVRKQFFPTIVFKVFFDKATIHGEGHLLLFGSIGPGLAFRSCGCEMIIHLLASPRKPTQFPKHHTSQVTMNGQSNDSSMSYRGRLWSFLRGANIQSTHSAARSCKNGERIGGAE
jgi:hypothetical protein